MITANPDITAALSAHGARRFAAVIPYEGIFIRDHWGELTACPWWYARSPDLEQQLAWRRDVIARVPQDWCELPDFPPRDVRHKMAIQVRGEEVFHVNRLTGQEIRLLPPQIGGWTTEGPLASIHPARLPQTRDEIAEALPASPEPDAGALRSDGSADLAEALFGGPARGRSPLDAVSGPFWSTYNLWGFEGMMAMVVQRPDLVEYACDCHLERARRSIRRSAALGAQIIWIEDCMTDMISPRAYAAFNLPYVREIVAEIRRAGMWSVHYFCGNPAGKWDLLLASGADALSLEEGKKGFVIDVEEIVDRVHGRCAVLGNLDAVGVLQDGDETTLRAEIARQVAAGQRNDGRFIMSLGSPVTPGTPVERVRLYCDLVHDL